MSRNRLLRGLRPMHPGEMLREDLLPALGKSKAEIARLLGISRQSLYDIIAEKQPVTPGMVLRSASCAATVLICGSISNALLIL